MRRSRSASHRSCLASASKKFRDVTTQCIQTTFTANMIGFYINTHPMFCVKAAIAGYLQCAMPPPSPGTMIPILCDAILTMTISVYLLGANQHCKHVEYVCRFITMLAAQPALTRVVPVRYGAASDVRATVAGTVVHQRSQLRTQNTRYNVDLTWILCMTSLLSYKTS